jgi:hypothetical protein
MNRSVTFVPRAAHLVTALALASSLNGCASSYTVLSRAEVVPSQSTRVSVSALIPHASQNQHVLEQLAFATEVLEQQRALLKERRNKVRSRRSILGGLALGTFALTTGGTGAAALIMGAKKAQVQMG